MFRLTFRSAICFQISGKQSAAQTNTKILIAFEQCKKQLTDQIQKLESAIKTCKQFNKKVELNLELKKSKKDLSKLLT
jgi:16S rRNA U1498 N3-methylase RsmE